MQLYIAHSPPLRSFLSSYEECRARSLVPPSHCCKPLRPCLSSRNHLQTTCLGWPQTQQQHQPVPLKESNRAKDKKKRVVFADSKGMSLTAVHLFSKSEDKEKMSPTLGRVRFDLAGLENAMANLDASKNAPQRRRLALDFAQPSADYLDFRNRLLRNSVCLENCALQERSLTGTIKVRNLAFEKTVLMRITFDSWSSFRDVECTFMNNVYGCQSTDTFTFALELPEDVPSEERVEFCVCFRATGREFWDNNDGHNYRLVPGPWRPSESEWSSNLANTKKEKPVATVVVSEPKKPIRKLGSQFGQIVSQRASCGFTSQWQGWGLIEDTAPYW